MFIAFPFLTNRNSIEKNIESNLYKENKEQKTLLTDAFKEIITNKINEKIFIKQ